MSRVGPGQSECALQMLRSIFLVRDNSQIRTIGVNGQEMPRAVFLQTSSVVGVPSVVLWVASCDSHHTEGLRLCGCSGAWGDTSDPEKSSHETLDMCHCMEGIVPHVCIIPPSRVTIKLSFIHVAYVRLSVPTWCLGTPIASGGPQY